MSEIERRKDVQAPSVVEALTRGEIDVQIKTAREFPRDVSHSTKQAKSMACMSPEAAAECRYVLPRAGKTIEGPSVRLAEIVAATWGNLRVGTRVIDIGPTTLTCAAVAHDLESNTSIMTEVQRRITDKAGRRYSDDMITTTSNAASSIALRNAVFKVVPRAFWGPIYTAAMAHGTKSAVPVTEQRVKALGWFADRGADEASVLRVLGLSSVDQIGAEHLATLRGLVVAIQEGTTSIEQTFAKDVEHVPMAEPEAMPEQQEQSQDDAERTAVLNAWRALSADLTADQIAAIKATVGIQRITSRMDVSVLDRCCSIAEEMVQTK